MSNIKIEELLVGDERRPYASELARSALGAPVNAQNSDYFMNAGAERVFAALDPDTPKLLGVIALCDFTSPNDSIYIDRLAIASEHRGQGFGRQLIDFTGELAARSALKRRLTVLPTAKSVEFYIACGFQPQSPDRGQLFEKLIK